MNLLVQKIVDGQREGKGKVGWGAAGEERGKKVSKQSQLFKK